MTKKQKWLPRAILIFSLMFVGCFAFRDHRIEAVIERWDTGSATDDHNFVNYFFTSSTGVFNFQFDERFLNAFTKKIRKQPTALRQIHDRMISNFQQAESQQSPVFKNEDEDWYFFRYTRDMIQYREITGDRIVIMIHLASMFDRPDWVTHLTMENLQSHWVERVTWMEENMYFIVFDHEKSLFVVDLAAKAAGQRVDPRRQLVTKVQELNSD